MTRYLSSFDINAQNSLSTIWTIVCNPKSNFFSSCSSAYQFVPVLENSSFLISANGQDTADPDVLKLFPDYHPSKARRGFMTSETDIFSGHVNIGGEGVLPIQHIAWQGHGADVDQHRDVTDDVLPIAKADDDVTENGNIHRLRNNILFVSS